LANGRAAKVIANYSNKPAFDSQKIYFQRNLLAVEFFFSLQKNKHKNTIFIIDEASMISDTNWILNFTKTDLCLMI
jgi:ATP-dependent exoDNAse (exonuclease V) alpha subunit